MGRIAPAFLCLLGLCLALSLAQSASAASCLVWQKLNRTIPAYAALVAGRDAAKTTVYAEIILAENETDLSEFRPSVRRAVSEMRATATRALIETSNFRLSQDEVLTHMANLAVISKAMNAHECGNDTRLKAAPAVTKDEPMREQGGVARVVEDVLQDSLVREALLGLVGLFLIGLCALVGHKLFVLVRRHRRRVFRRHKVDINLSMRGSTSSSWNFRKVQEISRGGARIEWVHGPGPGVMVFVSIAQVPRTAEVVWSDNKHVGVKFIPFLSEEQLLKILNDQTAATLPPAGFGPPESKTAPEAGAA